MSRRLILRVMAILGFALLAAVSMRAQGISQTVAPPVVFFRSASATSTQTSGNFRIPFSSTWGYLNYFATGITGAPAGCTITYAVSIPLTVTVDIVPASLAVSSSTIQTIAFTPSNGYQTFATSPGGTPQGDLISVTVSCATFPTAGTFTVSFSGALPIILIPNSPLPAGTNNIGNVGIVGALPAGSATSILGAVTTESTDTSYRAAISFTPAANPTDIFTIAGSATRVIRVTRVGLSCTATAAAATDVLFIKRSAADTAGTSSAATAVPLDANDAAATATVLAYTANPTLGAAVGNVSADKISISTVTGAPQFYFEDFGIRNTKILILRGTAQQLAVNFGGAALAGLACGAEVEWTER
jgi:hypothetical protein